MRWTGGIILILALLAGCAREMPAVAPITDTAYFDRKIEGLALELVNNATKRIRRAAVLDFKNPDGRTSQLGKYLSTKFSIISVKNRFFVIPSQGQVVEVMEKEGIDYKGSLDKQSAAKLGNALNVDGLIVGSISDLQKGSDIDLMIKIIDARSGNVVSAANINIYRSKSVSSLLQSF